VEAIVQAMFAVPEQRTGHPVHTGIRVGTVVAAGIAALIATALAIVIGMA
jgi:hypothetical protein